MDGESGALLKWYRRLFFRLQDLRVSQSRSSYILDEEGNRILLEDGSGYLENENPDGLPTPWLIDLRKVSGESITLGAKIGDESLPVVGATDQFGLASDAPATDPNADATIISLLKGILQGAGGFMITNLLPLSATDTVGALCDTAAAVTYTILGSKTVSGVASSGVFAQGYIGNAAANIWPATAGKAAVKLLLDNTSPDPRTVTLYLNGLVAANQISKFNIPANGSALFNGDHLHIYDSNGAPIT